MRSPLRALGLVALFAACSSVRPAPAPASTPKAPVPDVASIKDGPAPSQPTNPTTLEIVVAVEGFLPKGMELTSYDPVHDPVFASVTVLKVVQPAAYAERRIDVMHQPEPDASSPWRTIGAVHRLSAPVRIFEPRYKNAAWAPEDFAFLPARPLDAPVSRTNDDCSTMIFAWARAHPAAATLTDARLAPIELVQCVEQLVTPAGWRKLIHVPPGTLLTSGKGTDYHFVRVRWLRAMRTGSDVVVAVSFVLVNRTTIGDRPLALLVPGRAPQVLSSGLVYTAPGTPFEGMIVGLSAPDSDGDGLQDLLVWYLEDGDEGHDARFYAFETKGPSLKRVADPSTLPQTTISDVDDAKLRERDFRSTECSPSNPADAALTKRELDECIEWMNR